MDLRRQQRFPVHFQSVLSGQPRGESVGTIMNLSKSGCRVKTDSQFYSGMQVSCASTCPVRRHLFSLNGRRCVGTAGTS